MTKDEALSLLQKMRQIRQETCEMIAFLERRMQLQDNPSLQKLSYNPDAYLERAGDEDFCIVQRRFSCSCPCESGAMIHSNDQNPNVIEIVTNESQTKGG